MDKISALISKNTKIRPKLLKNSAYHKLQLVIDDYNILRKQYLSNPIDVNKISKDKPELKQELKMIDNVRKNISDSNLDNLPGKEEVKNLFDEYFNKINDDYSDIIDFLRESYKKYEDFYLNSIDNKKLDNRFNSNLKYEELNSMDELIRHPKSINYLCDNKNNQNIYLINEKLKLNIDCISISKVIYQLNRDPRILTKRDAITIINKMIFEPFPVFNPNPANPPRIANLNEFKMANPFNDILRDLLNIYTNDQDNNLLQRINQWKDYFENIYNLIDNYICNDTPTVNSLYIYVNNIANDIYNNIINPPPARPALVNINNIQNLNLGRLNLPVTFDEDSSFILNLVYSVFNEVLYDTRFYHSFDNCIINNRRKKKK